MRTVICSAVAIARYFSRKNLLMAVGLFALFTGVARFSLYGLSLIEEGGAQLFAQSSRASVFGKQRKSKVRSSLLRRESATGECGFLTVSSRKSSVHEVNRIVREASRKFQVEESLLYALMYTESRCIESARSPKGALGLMQVLPSTAEEMGFHAHTTRGNIFAAAKYLSLLKKQYGGDISLTLAAYNAGPGAVKLHGNAIPPYAETQAYVKKVLSLYSKIRADEV